MEFQKQVEWALEHVPALRFLQRDAAERIVRRAGEETKVLRIVLSIGLSIIFGIATNLLHQEVRSSGGSQAEQYVVVIVAASIGGALGAIIGQGVLRRRLELLAGGL